MNVTLTLKYVFGVFFYLSMANPVIGQTEEQEIKVELRGIGNAFLEGLGDSTSRILHLQKIDGRFAIQFEQEFAFEPDLLMRSTFSILEKSVLTKGYLVEVEDCENKAVVHSFRALADEKDQALACQLRELPAGCYVFYFTVIEGEPEVDINGIIALEDAAPLEVKATNGRLKYLLSIGGMIFLIVVIWYLYIRKKRQTVPHDYIQIGQFRYDQKGIKLVLEAQIIELSSKESDLLYLLYSNVNETVKREDILHQIWGDEGYYVGRTLDVFISKLRKKLEADTNLKILNIRGVGYRFVI